MLGRKSQRLEGLIGGLENLTGSGTPKAGPPVYDLTPATAFPQVAKTIKGHLVVPDPSAIILFDSQKILIRDGAGTYTSVNNAQWADNLPKLVQARIVQSFENARQLSAVSRPLDQLNPDYRLELVIRSFQIALMPSPKAVVDLTARLVSDKGVVADARVFSASIPAKSTEAPDAVGALNQAFSQVATDIVTWAVGAI
jgi:phospholipid/cholesterol/gamma-HCH transport system substrate-binding protein